MEVIIGIIIGIMLFYHYENDYKKTEEFKDLYLEFFLASSS